MERKKKQHTNAAVAISGIVYQIVGTGGTYLYGRNGNDDQKTYSTNPPERNDIDCVRTYIGQFKNNLKQ